MKDFIFFVGKPYPFSDVMTTCRKLGYLIGIFADQNVAIQNPKDYDAIVLVDFTSAETTLMSIKDTRYKIVGLLCTYENYIVAKSIIADKLKLDGMSLSSARMCTDKYLMRQAFLDNDKSITPQFSLISSERELLDIASKMSYPLIIKPTNLVKSMLVMKCEDQVELIENYNYAKKRIDELYDKYKIYDRKPQLIVEEYIIGRTCSIAAYVDKTGIPHYCEGIASLVNAQEIGVDDNYIYSRSLPAQFSSDLVERLFDTATKGIRALNMRSTPAHVELIYNEREVKLIEIGARTGGYRPRMYWLSYGIDLISQEIALAVGQLPELNGELKSFTGVFELFPTQEGAFESIEGPDQTSDYLHYSIKVKPGDNVGPAKNGYKACLVIVVEAELKTEYDRICTSIDAIRIRTK